MPYKNGELPAHVLAPAGGGHLRKDAAAAFNAMNEESKRSHHVELHASAPQNTYRTLAWQQHYYALYKSGQGNLAAVPGTSNHGWGLAIDLAYPYMRHIVDEIGEKYGWAKKWSDAPTEWWHLRYKTGVWHPHAQHEPVHAHKPARAHKPAHAHEPAPAHAHAHGTATGRRAQIAVAQQLLRAHGFQGVRVNGRLDGETAGALRQFQQQRGLPPTGVPDSATVAALRGTTAAASPTAPASTAALAGPVPHGLQQAWVQTSAIAHGPDPPGWTRAWVAPAPPGQTPAAPGAAPASTQPQAQPHGGRRRSQAHHRTGAR